MIHANPGGAVPTVDYHFCPKCGGRLEARRPPKDHRDRLVCGACGFIFYQGLKVAAGTLPVLDDGRIVLIRRGIPPGQGLWSFPCGYVELDETVAEGAARETLEETHLEVKLGPLLGTYSYPVSIDTNRVAVVVYLAEVVGGDLAPGDDATEARLCAYEEIPWDVLAFKSTVEAIRDWRARLAEGRPFPPPAISPTGR